MITKYLIEKSQGILSQVKEYRDEGKGYTAFNDGSTECEVGDFLYGMTRILRPVFVLESGTYKGISSAYIGQALKDNNRGILETFEIDESRIQESKQLWKMLDIQKYITSYHMPVQEYQPTANYDMLFLDSEPNIRFGELVKFYPFLNEGGYAFIHDCPPSLTQGNINPDHPDLPDWPFGPLPKEIIQWVREDKLRPIHFPNPRGMFGIYKTKKDEYKWM